MQDTGRSFHASEIVNQYLVPIGPDKGHQVIKGHDQGFGIHAGMHRHPGLIFEGAVKHHLHHMLGVPHRGFKCELKE